MTRIEPLTVACVLRSGGEYTPEHVQTLAASVALHLPDAAFVCLSDVLVPGVTTRPLLDPWPGWWAKIELFCRGVFAGRVLYLDLDTVVVGDLSDLASYRGPFAMLSDFYAPERPASGVMAWDADGPTPRAIWARFVTDPAGHMAAYPCEGDQGFIRSVTGDSVDRLQDHAPGQIVSYKVHCERGVPSGARIVCAHGRPKPWDAEWQLH